MTISENVIATDLNVVVQNVVISIAEVTR